VASPGVVGRVRCVGESRIEIARTRAQTARRREKTTLEFLRVGLYLNRSTSSRWPWSTHRTSRSETAIGLDWAAQNPDRSETWPPALFGRGPNSCRANSQTSGFPAAPLRGHHSLMPDARAPAVPKCVRPGPRRIAESAARRLSRSQPHTAQSVQATQGTSVAGNRGLRSFEAQSRSRVRPPSKAGLSWHPVVQAELHLQKSAAWRTECPLAWRCAAGAWRPGRRWSTELDSCRK